MRLAFCFLCFWICSLFGESLEIEVNARSAILMNAETGAILYEKHAHIPAFPASITKIATALFILDHKKPALDQVVTVSGESLKMKSVKVPRDSQPSYWQEIDGTRMGLLKGEILSFENLMYGLMMVSGNDAANVLAESVSGTIPTFMDEINQYIKGLGCLNTQFRNPHGLHHPEHFTTAYDICLITKKALQIPQFRDIVSTISYSKPKTNKQPQTEIKQHNPLLKPGKHFYSKAIGVKTGYHSNAQNTLVAAAEHDGRTLIAVLLGCEKRTGRYEDAVRLFEMAFAEKKERRRLVGPENLFTKEIPGSKSSLNAAPFREVAIEFFPAEEPVCKAFVYWDVPPLPIRKGQRVGEIRIHDQDGRVLQKGDLVAKEEVKATLLFVLQDAFHRIFH